MPKNLEYETTKIHKFIG